MSLTQALLNRFRRQHCTAHISLTSLATRNPPGICQERDESSQYLGTGVRVSAVSAALQVQPM